MSINQLDALTAFVASFVDELTKAGIIHVVISPGSRSAPLAYTFAEHPRVKVWVNLDERSAAFFALGIAKESRSPVVLLCTSGTAAANYLPAIVEAKHSRVPLIVLTADRPHELRDVGAPQSIAQTRLYGEFVKWFVDMPLPEATDDMLKYVRTTASRAITLSIQKPAGVVHLNFPFREPLIPDVNGFRRFFQKKPRIISITPGELQISQKSLLSIASKIARSSKGIIVCGQHDSEGLPEAVSILAEKIGYPLLADPLSQIRSSHTERPTTLIDCYHTLLATNNSADLKPDIILRFGAMPVSKALVHFIRDSNATQVVIDSNNDWTEPTRSATDMVYCDEVSFCQELIKLFDHLPNLDYLKKWQSKNKMAHGLAKKVLSENDFQEKQFFAQLSDLLPDECNLVVGNSMPVRDLDGYFPFTNKNVKIHCNRGVNGIDGVVSTALGVNAVSNKPTYLVIGDISFIHDLNSLFFATMNKLDLFIIIMNNNGGRIFSHLPQAKHPKRFDQLFGTPHHLEFAHIAYSTGAYYQRAKSLQEAEIEFQNCDRESGLRVLELIFKNPTVQTDTVRNPPKKRSRYKVYKINK